MKIEIDTGSEDYDRRIAAARERAGWELGDPSWAGLIVGAFLYPDQDQESLEREKAE